MAATHTHYIARAHMSVTNEPILMILVSILWFSGMLNRFQTFSKWLYVKGMCLWRRSLSFSLKMHHINFLIYIMFYPAPHRCGTTSVLIALKTVCINPAHSSSISWGYGYLLGHRMCQFGVLSALISVHGMNIYSLGLIKSWATVDQFISH